MAGNVFQFPGARKDEPQVGGARDHSAPFATPGVYQVKITLNHCEPQVWRRFLIPADYDFAFLAETIFSTFSWSGELFYYFVKGDELFLTDPDAETKHARLPRMKGETHVTADQKRINEVLAPHGSIMFYYDLEDYWEIEVEVERHMPDDAAPFPFMPVCLGGARLAPPEGVGGPVGYADFCYAMEHPDDPRHWDAKEWYDLIPEDRFDPERFDLFETNAVLAVAMLDDHEDEVLPSSVDELKEMCKMFMAEKLSSAACMTAHAMHGVYGDSSRRF